MSRERSEIVEWSIPVNISTLKANGTTNGYIDQTSVVAENTMLDVLSPSYFAKRKRGELLPVNPMSKVKFSLNYNSGNSDWLEIWNGNPGEPYQRAIYTCPLGLVGYWSATSQSSVFPPNLTTVPSWPSDSQVSVAALADARTKGFDLGTFVAEFGKTVRMITQFRDNVFRRAEQIQHALRARRTLNRVRQTTAQSMSAFSQTWLEGRYGWRVLAYELQDIHLALIKLQNLSSLWVRGYDTVTNAEQLVYRDGIYPLVNVKHNISFSNISRGHVLVEQAISREKRSGAIIEAVADGLAFADPLNTAWEVVPFSFIVDWFVNIGENIQAFSPTASGQVLDAWVSAREERRTTTVVTPLPQVQHSSFSRTYTGTEMYIFESIEESYERYQIDPSFDLTLSINLDTKKVVDLLSIFSLRYLRLLGSLTHNTRI